MHTHYIKITKTTTKKYKYELLSKRKHFYLSYLQYMFLTIMALRLRDFIFDMKLIDSVQVWGANAEASFNRRINNELAQWKFLINISIE